MDTDRIFEEFPAPSYRGTQRDALERIQAAFAAGNEAVLVRAPTGSGKSLLARAIAGCARRIEDARPSQPTGAYYTTPQVSQLDDVADDPLLDDLAIIRGKSNYRCILPGESETPVNRAPCVRRRGFDCSVQHRCPYFSDRAIASSRRIAAMTLAYFMRTAGSDTFRTRDVVVIDEAHGLAEWAEMYATIHLDARHVPGWADCRVPDIGGEDDAVAFAEALSNRLDREREKLTGREELGPEEVAVRDRLAERISELRWFVEDYRRPDSPTEWVVDQADGEDDPSDGPGGPITIKPLRPARYLRHTVWDRGERFALLSATILDHEAFARSIGLDPDRVALVDVAHTFPVENRPLYDVSVGPMTYEHRDRTIPKMARTIARLMARHPDEKGLVHAHSYSIQERLATELRGLGVGDRVRVHGREKRDDDLAAWKATDDPELFLSVKMEEALDLEGDLARWQVLAKAPYPNVNDARVARRLADDQWDWYRRMTLRTVIQACGRVVRAPDDHGATYVADSSLLDLFERSRWAMPDWFAEQVDRMSRPDLPEHDPRRALSGYEGGPGGRSRSRTTGRGLDRRGSDSPLADVWDSDGR